MERNWNRAASAQQRRGRAAGMHSEQAVGWTGPCCPPAGLLWSQMNPVGGGMAGLQGAQPGSCFIPGWHTGRGESPGAAPSRAWSYPSGPAGLQRAVPLAGIKDTSSLQSIPTARRSLSHHHSPFLVPTLLHPPGDKQPSSLCLCSGSPYWSCCFCTHMAAHVPGGQRGWDVWWGDDGTPSPRMHRARGQLTPHSSGPLSVGTVSRSSILGSSSVSVLSVQTEIWAWPRQ